MNKDTRTFTYGVMMLLIGGIAVGIHVLNIVAGTFEGALDHFLFAFSVYAAFDGLFKIHKVLS